MKRFSRSILKESHNRKLLKESRNRRFLKEAMENDRPLLRIYVGTYNKYNNGDISGKWISLPTDEETLSNELRVVAGNEKDPEFMIQDFESAIEGMEPAESENIYELNDIMTQLKELDITDNESDAAKALSVMLNRGASFEEALKNVIDGNYSFIAIDESRLNLEEALGMALVDDFGGVEQMNRDTLEQHFDYEGYGRDEIINRNLEKVDGGYIEIY